MKIKSLPQAERPVEKTLAYGADKLSNSELIAVILGSGTKDKSAIGLAEAVLSCDERGIIALNEFSAEELMRISGIGQTKAARLLASLELGKRIATSPRQAKKLAIASQDVVADLLMEEMRYLDKEYFKTILLNSKGEMISVETISMGELSSTMAHPREVFKPALKRSAAAVIFAHNHPSGDPTPSNDDIATNQRLVESGKLLGINVIDHIIIGDGRFTSFLDLGLV